MPKSELHSFGTILQVEAEVSELVKLIDFRDLSGENKFVKSINPFLEKLSRNSWLLTAQADDIMRQVQIMIDQIVELDNLEGYEASLQMLLEVHSAVAEKQYGNKKYRSLYLQFFGSKVR